MTGSELRSALLERYTFDDHEAAVLDLACAALDRVAELDAAVAAEGVMVAGHAGQPRVNPAVPEARQQARHFAQLVAQLGIPDELGAATVESLATVRARKGADARWSG